MTLLEQKLSTLKNSTKRIALTLCLLMTVCFSMHSQDTSKIIITSDQLRSANLIFAEHKEYSNLVPLLKLENTNLKEINKTWERTDSIKSLQINYNQKIINEQYENIDKLKKSIKIRNTVAGTSIIVAVLCLLLK